MFNAALSHEIFSQLMNGKVINKTELNNSGEFRENPLFAEILGNLNDYRNQYRMSGYEFIENSSYIYIRERVSKKEELKTDITMKVCVLLLLLGKYLTEQNYRFTKLTDKTGGLTVADFEAIEDMPDTQEILQKSGMKSRFQTAIKTTLIDRNILLQKPSSQTYILSDAGKAFFEEIIEGYQG
jgi:condensin complex protein MksE